MGKQLVNALDGWAPLRRGRCGHAMSLRRALRLVSGMARSFAGRYMHHAETEHIARTKQQRAQDGGYRHGLQVFLPVHDDPT